MTGLSRLPPPCGLDMARIPPEIACTANAVAWHAMQTPSGLAVLDGERRITWRCLANDLANTLHDLEASGARAGMLVGIEVGLQRYRQLLLFLACEVIGAISVGFAQPDLAHDDPVLPGCDLLLFDAPPRTRPERPFLVPPSDLSPQRPAPPEALARLRARPDPDRIVRISRTSGSTGRPKAVPITYGVQQHILLQRVAFLTDEVRANPRLVCLYSLGIRGAYTRVYSALLAGGTVFFPVAEQGPSLMAAGAVNWVMCVVGEATRIVQATPRPPPGTHLLFEMIGARVPRTLRILIRERLGAVVQVSYSSNETNTVAFTDDDDIGTLIPGAEAHIVDAQGNDLPMGQTGLVRVRTAAMASAYWNDPDLTDSAFIDGWYNTNDSGYIPEPGKLVVLGRADDMLNIGGVKLPPAPIEDEIMRLPNVRDAVVLAQGEDAADARLIVAVELEAPAPVDALRGQIAPMLMRYVTTFELLAFPSFPRTESGKIRRPDLEAAVRRRHGG